MIKFREINKEDVDYLLLQRADPSLEVIQSYVADARIIEAYEDAVRIGCLVLNEISPDTVEFKNIAIYEAFQNKGYGYKLLMYGLDRCKMLAYTTAIIGTGNSSIGQLYLYQKAGFEIDYVVHNFFVENYSEKIIENGIHCKHKIVLLKLL
jgi:GNAT superfamily N-acetyltransferase